MKKEFKEFRILILIFNIDPKVLDCALTFCAVCRFEMVSHKPCQGFHDQWKPALVIRVVA